MEKSFLLLLLLISFLLTACNSDNANTNSTDSNTDTENPITDDKDKPNNATLTADEYNKIFESFMEASRFAIVEVDYSETRIIDQTTTTHSFKGTSNFSSSANASAVKVTRQGLGLLNDSDIKNNETQKYHFFQANDLNYYYNADLAQYGKYPLTFDNSRFTFLIQEPIYFAYYTAHGKDAYLNNTLRDDDGENITLTTTLTNDPDIIIMIENFLGNVYNQEERSALAQFINQDKTLDGKLVITLDKATNAMLEVNLDFIFAGKSSEGIPMSTEVELEYMVTENNSPEAIIVDEAVINGAVDMTNQ